ncbi:MAG: c-type cytochrome, partial [Acidobacteria bacterium]|nr:c-type cytochrome [Acidobacteriota bacterium]
VLAVVLLVAAAAVGYVYVASARLLARTYAITSLPDVPVRSDPASLARGKYLADHVAMCADCHDRDLGGKVVSDSAAMGRLASANLTRGQGGIGAAYSNQDFARAILHGVKRDGRAVVFMPSANDRFTEADFAALIAYVRSVPPVDRTPSPMSIGPIGRALGVFTDFPLAPAARIDHDTVRFATPPDGADTTATGGYLVAAAGCQGCHGAQYTGGGGPPPGASNITPVGIGGWNEQQFLTAIRDHRRPDGTTIDEAMPRAYGEMADQDLRAIFTFLRTVPPAGEKTKRQTSAN